MQRGITVIALTISLSIGYAATKGPVQAAEGRYQVKITNLTNAQSFTPILTVTHSSGVTMFLPGTAASDELRTLAEEGNVAPLSMLLAATPGVADMVTSPGLLTRGVTADFEITATGSASWLSFTAMLIPTNDAFVGINTELPEGAEVKVVYAYAYDAGTERNDELCASIPGPSFSECGGPGGGAMVGGGEGAVTIHRGIQGVGDFEAATRDFNNPVARVTIRRLW
jgi:hypothetical protein